MFMWDLTALSIKLVITQKNDTAKILGNITTVRLQVVHFATTLIFEICIII